MRPLPPLAGKLAVLFLALLGAASSCAYWSLYTDAVHAALASSSGLKPKALTDLYPSWYASRALLLDHRDPYSVAVNHELQIAFYGKVLDPSRPEERRDQQRFAYPVYFIFFVAPLAPMQFHNAAILFRVVLVVCAILSMTFWMRFVRLRLSPLALTSLLALTITSVSILQNLSLLQPFLLPACFIAAAAAAMSSGNLFIAGMLLAMATVKPQICLPLLVWCACWAASDWRRRRTLFLGFSITLIVLLLVSAWLLPAWWQEYPGVLRAYAEYTKATSFLGTLLQSPLSWIVSSLVLFIVAEYCWRVRREPANSPAFTIALAFVLTLTVAIIPAVVQPYNHFLLFPTVLLTVRYWGELMQRSRVTQAATFVFCGCASLPWLLSIVAVANPFNPHRDWLLKMWSIPLAASMAFPFACFGMLILLQKVATPQTGSAPTRRASPSQSSGLTVVKEQA